MQFLESMPPQDIPVVAAPQEECAWCWQLLHPGQLYPEEWSSTICNAHIAWIGQQAIERRARRAVKGQVQ